MLIITLAAGSLYIYAINYNSGSNDRASALAIAAVGLFGVLSYNVAQRRREIALRAALGATPADAIHLVLRQGVLVTIAGLSIGVWLSFVFNKYLAGLLYGVQSHDWLSYLVVCVSITIFSLIACLVPAIRAARVNPLRALRQG